MAKNLKRLIVCMMVLSIMISMVVLPVAAEETTPAGQAVVSLIPGGDPTTAKAEIPLEAGTLVREVTATTGEIVTESTQTIGELKAPQSALKFDRNSTADQKAQKVARELYTDTGHFTDPSSVTVAGAPEGYPFKYIGYGDYSGHYVSHIRVIFERDANGNAIKDANGQYVIKELQHSGGTTLHYNGEPTTNVDGPFHYATGTRSQQFLLKDEAGHTLYGYCIDVETGIVSSSWYAIANLEDNNYYTSQEAEDHVRGILFNGYWGTEAGATGSLANLKTALKAAIANGEVEDDYKITLVNRKKYTTGYELQEGEYHHGSYVYWDIPAVEVTLTAEIIDAMTEGEALDAMQSAIWSYANGSQATLDGKDGMVVGDLSVASSAMSDSLNKTNDPEGAARTRALYAYLMKQTASAETVIVNDKTFVEDMSLTVGKNVYENVYEAAVNFSNSFTINQNADNLNVVLTYIDAKGEEKTITKPLTGEDALVAVDGYYTIDGLELRSDVPFQFTLNIVGDQQLTKNAYILTSEKGTTGSQTIVTMAEGSIKVDVSKTVDITFSVKDTLLPPTTPPAGDIIVPVPPVNKEADGLDEKDQTDVTLTVGGETKAAPVDIVIALGAGIAKLDNTSKSMINLIEPLVEAGVPVKLGLVAVEHYKDVAMGLTELTAENYKTVIDKGLADIQDLPAGPTNLHSNIEAAKAMLDADGEVLAENKYFYVIATGRTYNYDNEIGRAHV